MDIHIHDTAWVPAHFHYTMFGGAVVMLFAACHYWWPKMFGRMYNEKIAIGTAVVFFFSFNLTYMPLFFAGMLGMPRRYADYLPRYEIYHQLSTIGALVMVATLLLMIANLVHGMLKGKPAPDDPWGGATLEWRVPTPPPTLNFTDPPDISRGPYEYPEEVADA